MKLSIIIVNWNVKDLLLQNLTAIYKNTNSQDFDFEVFVVDNDSKDGSVDVVKQNFPQVNVIANNFNAGFAKANNQAITLSKSEYILLLNPDMQVNKNTLKDMVDWMDINKDVGVASCKLLDENGNVLHHIRRFPKLFDQIMIVLKLHHLFPFVLNSYLMKNFDYTQQASVDSVRGSFFMIRKSIIQQIGMLDERFFIWFEEVDFCKRVIENNQKVMYVPIVECVDFVGKSFEQVMGYKKQKMFTDSMIKYFQKHHSWFSVLCLKLVLPIGLGLAYLKDLFIKIKK